MVPSLRRRIISRIGRLFGLHPDVSGLISGAFRLVNPKNSALPTENLPLVSRVIASGLWNYSFFQFYPNFSRPFWAERQYDVGDPAYLPRAGSPISVNLTHRTWMGLRSPSGTSFGLVDPAGSLSPVIGYYSIEMGLLERRPDGDHLSLAVKKNDFEVKQELVRHLPVPRTIYRSENLRVRWTVAGSSDNPNVLLSSLQYRYEGKHQAWLVLGIRPFNPEGPASLARIRYTPGDAALGGGIVELNGLRELKLLTTPDRVLLSNLAQGDAYYHGSELRHIDCDMGVATAALLFPLDRNTKGEVAFIARSYEREILSSTDEQLIRTLLQDSGTVKRKRAAKLRENLKYMSEYRVRRKTKRLKNLDTAAVFDPHGSVILKTATVSSGIGRTVRRWEGLLDRGAAFQCARNSWTEAAQVFSGHLLSLQTGTSITPGVFTYRLFWFRDAAFMLSSLLAWNFVEETDRVIHTYSNRIDRRGFFRSQEGEWDSNGQALWTLAEYARHTGAHKFLRKIFPLMVKGSDWILRKRREGYEHRLMPSGFSAEHLGPADFYYWDNLWSIGGLERTVEIARRFGETKTASRLAEGLEYYRKDILELSAEDRRRLGILPAAPGRGIDGGIIGSVCLLYPLELKLFPEDEVRRTIETIYTHFFPEGLFYQPVIHSGYNIYLSIQVAQCFFRLGNIDRAREILKTVLRRRTDLWTYPEAVHPRTGGGVMGDGYHGWAFAEILMLLRVFAAYRRDTTLEIFSGLRKRELFGGPLKFGPFPMDGSKLSMSGSLSEKSGELMIEYPDVSATGAERLHVHLPLEPRVLGSIRVEGARVIGGEDRLLKLGDLSDRIRLKYG